jgi:threonine dehydrogenase-like Zn-dependent dehydrogenase
MRELALHGKIDIRFPDSKIEHNRDAIITVTARATCISGRHIFDVIMDGLHQGCFEAELTSCPAS